MGFWWGYYDATLLRQNASLDQDTGKAPLTYLELHTDIGISPWETYIVSSENLCMVGGIDDTGNFKFYFWKYTNADIILTWTIEDKKKHHPLLLVSRVGDVWIKELNTNRGVDI